MHRVTIAKHMTCRNSAFLLQAETDIDRRNAMPHLHQHHGRSRSSDYHQHQHQQKLHSRTTQPDITFNNATFATNTITHIFISTSMHANRLLVVAFILSIPTSTLCYAASTHTPWLTAIASSNHDGPSNETGPIDHEHQTTRDMLHASPTQDTLRRHLSFPAIRLAQRSLLVIDTALRRIDSRTMTIITMLYILSSGRRSDHLPLNESLEHGLWKDIDQPTRGNCPQKNAMLHRRHQAKN